MKMISLLLMLLTIAATAEDKMVCFKVKGMTCAACSVTIKAAVRKLNGVTFIDVFSNMGKAQVKLNADSIEPSHISRAITDAGYEATLKTCN